MTNPSPIPPAKRRMTPLRLTAFILTLAALAACCGVVYEAIK